MGESERVPMSRLEHIIENYVPILTFHPKQIRKALEFVIKNNRPCDLAEKAIAGTIPLYFQSKSKISWRYFKKQIDQQYKLLEYLSKNNRFLIQDNECSDKFVASFRNTMGWQKKDYVPIEHFLRLKQQIANMNLSLRKSWDTLYCLVHDELNAKGKSKENRTLEFENFEKYCDLMSKDWAGGEQSISTFLYYAVDRLPDFVNSKDENDANLRYTVAQNCFAYFDYVFEFMGQFDVQLRPAILQIMGFQYSSYYLKRADSFLVLNDLIGKKMGQFGTASLDERIEHVKKVLKKNTFLPEVDAPVLKFAFGMQKAIPKLKSLDVQIKKRMFQHLNQQLSDNKDFSLIAEFTKFSKYTVANFDLMDTYGKNYIPGNFCTREEKINMDRLIPAYAKALATIKNEDLREHFDWLVYKELSEVRNLQNEVKDENRLIQIFETTPQYFENLTQEDLLVKSKLSSLFSYALDQSTSINLERYNKRLDMLIKILNSETPYAKHIIESFHKVKCNLDPFGEQHSGFREMEDSEFEQYLTNLQKVMVYDRQLSDFVRPGMNTDQRTFVEILHRYFCRDRFKAEEFDTRKFDIFYGAKPILKKVNACLTKLSDVNLSLEYVNFLSEGHKIIQKNFSNDEKSTLLELVTARIKADGWLYQPTQLDDLLERFEDAEKIIECMGFVLPGYSVIKPLGKGNWGQTSLVREESREEEEFANKVLKIPLTKDRAFNPEDKLTKRYGPFDMTAEELLRYEEAINGLYYTMGKEFGRKIPYIPIPPFMRVMVQDMHYEREKLFRTVDPFSRKEFFRRETVSGLLFAFVHGQTLETHVAQNLEYPERVQILEKTAFALDYIHLRNVAYNDVNKTNFIVGEDGQLYVIDFGLAREIKSRSTAIGSRLFAPPERVLEQGSVSVEADVYSYGVLAYWVMVDDMPYGYSQVESKELLAEKVAAGELRPDWGKLKLACRWEAGKNWEKPYSIIERCLAFDPTDRYETMHEVENEWAAIRGELGG